VFESRLKASLIVLAAALLVIVGRLVHLQVLRADFYRGQAERLLIRRPEPLPFVRGSILDRGGGVLVRDEPCWDITVDYGVLAAAVEEEAVLLERHVTEGPSTASREGKRWRRAGHYVRGLAEEATVQALREDVARMWTALAPHALRATGVGIEELHHRAREIHDRVERIRRAVAARRGFAGAVAEEADAHPLLGGLDASDQILARESLADFPWAHVEPSWRRVVVPDATAFAHILGRMGPVSAEDVAGDREADDPFARYRADERRGVSGVELAAERRLRGRRGQITLDRDGHPVGQTIDAEHGQDVRLTIHSELQRRLYGLMARAIAKAPDSPGGAIVVLDVQTREALALVSYPSYDPSRFDQLFSSLRDDTRRLPLQFRAVANGYAPGSVVKPLVCLAGLLNGRITLESEEECLGYLHADRPDEWRCWEVHGTTLRKAHGLIDVVEALRGSCNVFMYRLGERLGVDAICSAFDMAGIGRASGTGLAEDNAGINPTPSWLMRHRNAPVTPGAARNFAIGQGEALMTPVQVANLAAIYASGQFRPVTLIKDSNPPPLWTLPGSPEHWSAIRRGIYEVVNDPDGTAYDHARLASDGYVICGKTGSATARPRPTSYRIRYVDPEGRQAVAIVPADAKQPAIDRFTLEYPHIEFDTDSVQPVAWWPSAGGDDAGYAHAWFAGFLQATNTDHQPDWAQPPRIAFSVLVEFGGSGGRVSGPIAREVAAEVLQVLGPDLDPDSTVFGDERE